MKMHKVKYIIPVSKSIVGNLQIVIFFKLVKNIVNGYSISIIKSSPNIAINRRVVPWFTFPAIEFLDSLELMNKEIFEFGSGNSTVYFSKRGCHVSSVESSPIWGAYVESKCQASILIASDKNEYLESIHADRKPFDIIVIDGLYRADCAREIFKYKYLSNVSVVILDNSNWFPKTLNFLTQELGFLRIDFNGYGPKNHFPWKTTIFTNPKIVNDGWSYKNNDPIGSISTFDPNDF
jgi:hypothetical protein